MSPSKALKLARGSPSVPIWAFPTPDLCFQAPTVSLRTWTIASRWRSAG